MQKIPLVKTSTYAPLGTYHPTLNSYIKVLESGKMPTRPDPPADCEEVSEYYSGDKVYYFRTSKWSLMEFQNGPN